MVTFYFDLLYALSLSNNYRIDYLLDKLNPNLITDNCFHNEYLKELFKANNIEYKQLYEQEAIDNVFYEFAIWFHENINTTYATNRNITDKQITDFKIGSTHILSDIKEVDIFVKYLLNKGYDKGLVVKILTYHANIHNFIEHHYGVGYTTTFPCINNNICNGIVYRTENYKKLIESRNLSKFFCSHPSLYMFNLETLNNYEDIYVVEGVFDLLAMNSIGIYNVISVSYNRLSNYHAELLKDKKITFIHDPDSGGINGLEFNKKYKLNAKYFTTPEMDICDLINLDANIFLKFLKSIQW